jgi:hypothetical protein
MASHLKPMTRARAGAYCCKNCHRWPLKQIRPQAGMTLSLFGPDRNRDCDCGRNSFNRPFIFADWKNREATSLRAAPTRAKALRIKPPRTSALTAGFCERLPGHLSVRREGHFEFNATGCGSDEGLAVEECRLDVAWSHWLRSEGSARVEKYCRNNEWFCAHRTSGGWPTLKNPVRLIYTQSRGSGGRMGRNAFANGPQPIDAIAP